MVEPIKAVALISGGLDSMLAAKVVMEQGVHVEGINFFTGFCVEGHTHAIRAKHRVEPSAGEREGVPLAKRASAGEREGAPLTGKASAAEPDGAPPATKRPKRNNALWVAEQLGIKLHIIDVIEEYKKVLLEPKHGYGRNLNPCLDCKIFMVGKALTWSFMEERGFDFVITGEVVGQRPKSQRRDTMGVIAQESGADDRLLRPLSARNLPPTLPERNGWVDREALYGFEGRNRKPQIELARRFGFSDWAQPAGGCCFLTDQQYSRKLADLWDSRGSREYELDDIMLLKVGRHIRPAAHFKLIVGREEGENNYLEGYRRQFIALQPTSHKGPLCLIDGTPQNGDIQLAARVLARYSQGREASSVTVVADVPDGTRHEYTVAPMPPAEIPATWHV